MAIFFYPRKRINPQNVDAEATFYPAPAYAAEIDVKKLATEISDNTALTPTEVTGVLQSFITTIPKYLLLGYKVRLDGFGIFKTSFEKTTGGYANAKEVTANDIGGVKLTFTPELSLKAKFQNPEFVKYGANYTLATDTEDSSEEAMKADTAESTDGSSGD